MHISNILSSEKKWVLGPWNSNSPIEIGHLREAKGTVHFHSEIFEYFVIIKGSLTTKIGDKEHTLKEGDVCLIEPTEVHSIIQTSEGLSCLLIKFPHKPDDKTILEG